MKILLISPPTKSVVKEVLSTTAPPAGLAYLASVVKEEHDVKIVDSLIENLSFDKVEKIIKKFYPDLVGITATTSMMPDAYKIARIVKNIDENIKIVIGGPHVTFLPEKTIEECSCIDFVIRGEGEITFKELVDYMIGKRDVKEIRGLTYKQNGSIKSNSSRELIKNLDSIPLPSYELLPMDKYNADGVKFGTIMTSRGCPFNCIFCSSSLQFGKRWRAHSVNRVIEEISMLHNEYGIREIEFLDDTFTLNKKRAILIAENIKKEGMDIRWTASSRVNTFSKEVAKSMKKGGCHTVYFGIESGSQKTLNFIGKGITLQQSLKAVEDAHDANLTSLGSFIIGFPDESKDDVKNTIKFSKKVGVNLAQFTVATPYPGTRLWNIALKRNLITSFDWRKYTTLTPIMKLKYFTLEQIMKWLHKAYASFYLRPKFFLWDIIQNHGFIIKKVINNIGSLIGTIKVS